MFIRENTAELLALTVYVVHTAENGKIEAENALATRLDLVICDITMSVLDGYGVLHIFNQNPQLAGVPLIFHTAKTERTDLRRGVELRAYDYLTKPFSENELLSAINGRLARFRHLKPYYDLKAGALDELLDDARAVGKQPVSQPTAAPTQCAASRTFTSKETSPRGCILCRLIALKP